MTDFDPDDQTARVSAHEVEVPGSPEAVWQAIATGPGIATWFVPAEVDEREGGRITTDHGSFGKSEGVVTRWEPPRRFAYEERDWNPDSPDAPPWATEMLVSAKDGGSCVVRLVSGFFTGGDGWEKHLEGTDEGWVAALRNLRLALTYFPGSTAVSMQAAGMVADRSPDDVGRDLLGVLGVADLPVGSAVRLRGDAPETVGTVVDVGRRSITLRTDEPHAGIVEIGVYDQPGATVMVRGYLHGPGGDRVAAAEEPRWSDWLRGHVPGIDVRT